MPMAKLDELVIENVKDRLLQPERLTNILEALLDRQGAKDSAVQDRRAALAAELAQKMKSSRASIAPSKTGLSNSTLN